MVIISPASVSAVGFGILDFHLPEMVRPFSRFSPLLHHMSKGIQPGPWHDRFPPHPTSAFAN